MELKEAVNQAKALLCDINGSEMTLGEAQPPNETALQTLIDLAESVLTAKGPEKKNEDRLEYPNNEQGHHDWVRACAENQALDAYRLWSVGRLPSVEDIRGVLAEETGFDAVRDKLAAAIHSLMKERVL